MIFSLLSYDNEGNVNGGIIPLVDGGTEGFKGNSRIICPTITACLECNLDLYPPQGFLLIIYFYVTLKKDCLRKFSTMYNSISPKTT